MAEVRGESFNVLDQGGVCFRAQIAMRVGLDGVEGVDGGLDGFCKIKKIGLASNVGFRDGKENWRESEYN